MASLKPILVIGATGAQGLSVIKNLLRDADDGSPTPYRVRALTRDPSNPSAQDLLKLGSVELFKGSFTNFTDVAAALEGMYGAFVNTDGFLVAEQTEIFCGMRIYELAKWAKLEHFIWSAIPSFSKDRDFDPRARTPFADGKGRVSDWIRAQPSTTEHGMTWTILSGGPYMDMLSIPTLGPLNIRQDGTVVFAWPLGKGKLELCPLDDLGFYARYIFDHRSQSSARTLECLTEGVTGADVVEAFEKVSGKKAAFVDVTYDQWSSFFLASSEHMGMYAGKPEEAEKYHVMTRHDSFKGFWFYHSTKIVSKTDRTFTGEIPHKMHTLESWMRANNYDGSYRLVLKSARDSKRHVLNKELTSQL